MIDLRSDTVTKPTQAVREVMANAFVGDDVYGEDPSVNELQHEMASLFGKEAGLFVPSGVMSNQLAIKAHTKPGDEVIVEYDAHVFQYETAAPSMLSAVQIHPIHGNRGILNVDVVRDAIRSSEYYYPETRLACIENTHNRAGGTVYPLEAAMALYELMQQRGIKVHLDGARIWNAHVKTNIPLREYGKYADSVSVCFSKGLGAPVGSMLLGTNDLIERARKYRKIFGGGMRQAGILAAAAQYVVKNHLPLLLLDHERAGRFAKELSRIPTIDVNPEDVETNIVMFAPSNKKADLADIMKKFSERGLLLGFGSSHSFRAVFHLDISDEDTDSALSIIHDTLGEL